MTGKTKLAIGSGVIIVIAAVALHRHSGLRRAPQPGGPWPHHTIDSTSRGADGVRLTDVNGDGLADVVTAWENGGVVRIYLNPGRAAVGRVWPFVTAGVVGSPEDAIAVDLDRDGRMDVVSASEGEVQRVQIHWAPRDPARYTDSAAWSTRALPATALRQWMALLPMELDGRNGTDLVVGSKGPNGVIGWLESPPDPRRAEEWRLHELTAAGWVMSLIAHDMDRDGDPDVVASDRANAGVFWLENPGAEGNREGVPWRVHRVGGAGREVLFIDLADLDHDGWVEVIAAAKPTDLLIMRRTDPPPTAAPEGQDATTDGSRRRPAVDREAWSTQLVTVDPSTIGRAKGVAVADLTLDGAPELVLTFEGARGDLSGVVWTEIPSGNRIEARAIRDVSGPEGTKFDLVALVDLDGDGDLDVVACAEERLLGVVWYENPTR